MHVNAKMFIISLLSLFILWRTYHIHSVIILCSVFHHYYFTQPLTHTHTHTQRMAATYASITISSFLLFIKLVSEQTWYFSSSWSLQVPKIWTLTWLHWFSPMLHRVSLLLNIIFLLMVSSLLLLQQY